MHALDIALARLVDCPEASDELFAGRTAKNRRGHPELGVEIYVKQRYAYRFRPSRSVHASFHQL
jgi:hypothetical protein